MAVAGTAGGPQALRGRAPLRAARDPAGSPRA